MTLLWLFIWVCTHAPNILNGSDPSDTSWLIALGICVFIDIGAGLRKVLTHPEVRKAELDAHAREEEAFWGNREDR